MLVRTQILIFGLIGNIIIAGILLYMNVQNQNIQTKSANSQYTSIVESAWVQSIDNSFSNLNSWGTSGEKGQQYWNPYSEIPLFIDIGFEGFDYANPLIEALDQEIESDLFIMIDEMFLDEVDLGNISFIKIYNEIIQSLPVFMHLTGQTLEIQLTFVMPIIKLTFFEMTQSLLSLAK